MKLLSESDIKEYGNKIISKSGRKVRTRGSVKEDNPVKEISKEVSRIAAVFNKVPVVLGGVHDNNINMARLLSSLLERIGELRKGQPTETEWDFRVERGKDGYITNIKATMVK